MRAARVLLVLAVAWPAITKGQTCQGDACPVVLPQRVAARLAARLSDEELAATIIELLTACDGREECARSLERDAIPNPNPNPNPNPKQVRAQYGAGCGGGRVKWASVGWR